jgi:parallel beta-helix repeat protein
MGRGARPGRLGLALSKVAVCGAVSVGFVAVMSPPAHASPPSTLFVTGSTGTDSGNCSTRATPCATISYALTQAASGATIYVANGTYAEQLTITHPVTIKGKIPAQTIIKPTALPLSDADPDSATPQKYIVDVAPNTKGVDLKNLTIDGSGASSTFTSCAQNYVGVYFHDSSGHLGSVGISGIQLPRTLSTCKDGYGVYVATDSGSTAAVNIMNVQISLYQQNGITCDDAGTICSISTSRITGNGPTNTVSQNGVQVFGASASMDTIRVFHNTYTGGGAGHQGMGLRLLNAGTLTVKNSLFRENDVDIYAGEVPAAGHVPPTTGTWTFMNNMARLGTDAVLGGARGYGDGIVVDSTTHTLKLTGNTARGNAEYGIALYGTAHVTASLNTEKFDKAGLYAGGPGTAVGTSTANTVTRNIADQNQQQGILADLVATDSGNTFTSNASTSNTTFQIEDRSRGGGTKGTANTWTTNRCHGGPSSSPPGLC